jgi:hypothetical protein
MEHYFKKFIDTDLVIGQKYEEWFNDIFIKEKVKYNNDNKFDIIKTDGTTYEVKTDVSCFIYYRFGFEISSRGKLSGIHSTEAEYWVTIIPLINKIFIIKTSLLKEILKNDQNRILRRCGDEQSSKMILWDFNYFYNLIKNEKGFEEIKIDIPIYFNIESQFNRYKEYKNRLEREERCEDIEIYNHFKKFDKIISI